MAFGGFGQRACRPGLLGDVPPVPGPQRSVPPEPLPLWATALGGLAVGAIAGVAIASAGSKAYRTDATVGAVAGLVLGGALGAFANRSPAA